MSLTLSEKTALVAELSAHPHVFHDVDFADDDYDQEEDDKGNAAAQTARSKVPLDAANVISSRLDTGHVADNEDHTPALDIDIPVRLVPSTTPGHHHLYIDVPMTWDNYERLLDVLGDVGILEPGYVSASKRRRATHLRLPWVSKVPPPDAA